MKPGYLLLLLLAVLFLMWTHTHTDEIPIVLSLVLLTNGILAAAFPRFVLLSVILAGGAVFAAETLVHFSVLPAPYPPSKGLPWAALIAYVPALAGAGIGYALRTSLKHMRT